MRRAYELMVIFDGDLEEAAFEGQVKQLQEALEAEGGRVATTDVWGRRRFAYEINHKSEGYYVVYEVVTETPGFPDLERTLRLADEVVRHKLFRLPDREATRRGLLGAEEPV